VTELNESTDPIDMKLLDRWQRDFPLVPRPYLKIGKLLDLSESEVLDRFGVLVENKSISRIGAVFKPNTIGASTLAALSVPDAHLEAVAEVVNDEPGVNHNYEREHLFNLWFVVTGADRAAITATLERIKEMSGCPLIEAPLDTAFHLDLGFGLEGRRRKPAAKAAAEQATEFTLEPEDRQLISRLENGLPFSGRPYLDIGAEIGLSEARIIGRIAYLVECGVISRFGVIVRHRTLGYRSNAMAVWDVNDDLVPTIGTVLAQHPAVTLCYSRLRDMPHWPYNLFCMVHARERSEALAVISELNKSHGLSTVPSAVLFSRRCFKQRGAKYSADQRAA